jgi:hypothetical protein
MKINYRCSAFILLLIAFTNLCNAQHYNQAPAKVDYSSCEIVKELGNVLIGGKAFRVKVLRDKLELPKNYRKREGEALIYGNGLITLLVENYQNQTVFVKKFDQYASHKPISTFNIFKGLGQPFEKEGKLYFMLNTSYGGSGSISNLYHIDFKNNHIIADELFSGSGELTYILWDKNDDDLIFMQGIWGKGESHFADHRYKISKYTYNKNINSFYKSEIGETKLRYSSLDNNRTPKQVLADIKRNEPQLIGNIEPYNYTSREK